MIRRMITRDLCSHPLDWNPASNSEAGRGVRTRKECLFSLIAGATLCIHSGLPSDLVLGTFSQHPYPPRSPLPSNHAKTLQVVVPAEEQTHADYTERIYAKGTSLRICGELKSHQLFSATILLSERCAQVVHNITKHV